MELGLGDEGVKDLQDGLLVAGVEGGQVVEFVPERVLRGVQGPAGSVGDDEVVEADVEGL
ncbi:MAG: hypothetical protein ACT4P1_16840 [Sporichthyaceae bacterium]